VLHLVARAPAKVNLVLVVEGPRPDGYHEIESLMAPLDLCDRVEVRLHPGRRGEVACRVPGHPELDGDGNLAARAALALRRRLGRHDRCEIRIEKRVPVTAGLGGGSSDAAAVLRCLARAYRVRDRRLLGEVALEVGSDVPFFLGPGPAWVRGRGERLEPVDLPRLVALLAHPRSPALAIRAADAYRWLDETRRGRARARRAIDRLHPFRSEMAANDLQAACFIRHPDLLGLARRLEVSGARAAIMSGSGPTVFGLFADRNAARAAMPAVAGTVAGGETVDVFIVRTLRRMPGVSPWKSPRSASSP
jgi:4-diphosphocytidyl-2-C-methyl-D-erythritol kinase